ASAAEGANLFTWASIDVKTRLTAFHDVEIRAVRQKDGMTAVGRVVALGDFEGFVAGQAIDVLHQLCPTVSTTDSWRRSGHEPLDSSAIKELREAHTLSVVSLTGWMDARWLNGILAARQEIKARDLRVLVGETDVDLQLQVTRDVDSPVTWRYKLLDRHLQDLVTGSVGAMSERRAAEKIVDLIARLISRSSEEPSPAVRVSALGHKYAPSGPWR